MTDLPESGAVGQAPERSAPTSAAGRVDRVLSLVFLAAVVLCLVVPLLQTLYPLVPAMVPPLEERRQANPFPSPRLLLGANGNFAQGLNAWFDDRVGFRDLFVRTKNQIDYSVFGTSRKVLIGAHGWLFAQGERVPIDRFTPPQLAALEQGFLALAQRLAARGVRLIVVGYPDKSAIYPEMTPAQLPGPRPGDNDEKLRRFLASRPELGFIDAGEILWREKSRTAELLYFKTDMHVSQVAQVPIVKEIVARIAAAEGRPDIRWDETFALKHDTVGDGSEARFLSLLVPVMEPNHPYFDGAYSVGGTELDGAWTVPDPNVANRADAGIGRPFDWEFRSRPELCAQRLPGMVLFGNSFSDNYWPLGLHRYFCFIRRARDPISRLDPFIATMPAGTKYFIYQYYAPTLPEMPPH